MLSYPIWKVCHEMSQKILMLCAQKAGWWMSRIVTRAYHSISTAQNRLWDSKNTISTVHIFCGIPIGGYNSSLK